MALNKVFVSLSRDLRKNQTPWEKKLWMNLKAGRFFGLKFKRQQIIGKYIFDFSCFEKKLIIELDGSGHAEPEVVLSDRGKQEFAESLGYKVIRFNNNDVQNNLDGVLERIRQLVK